MAYELDPFSPRGNNTGTKNEVPGEDTTRDQDGNKQVYGEFSVQRPFGEGGMQLRGRDALDWNTRNFAELRDFTENGRAGINVDSTNAEQARQKQQDYIQMLLRQAQGDPNSLAQQQLTASNQAAAGQMAGGMAARGNFGGAGAGMRLARAGQGAIERQGVDQSRLLMMKEQQAAQQALLQALQGQRGQDVGMANLLSGTALQNYATDDAYLQQLMGQTAGHVSGLSDVNRDYTAAKLGFDLGEEERNNQMQSYWLNKGVGAGAGAFGTLSQNGFFGGGSSGGIAPGGGGYGGQSIVPVDDK